MNEQKRHIEKALDAMGEQEFIKVDPKEVTVTFKIQSDPISMVGVNGVQAMDMLVYVKELFKSLDETFTCIENKGTIQSLEMAIAYQERRTADREARNVEGKNEA